MRIIAGKHKGRRIELGRETTDIIRPTSDFAREAIFNILTHGKHGLNGHSFADKKALDVFCGSGALGLEALSRGAAKATFIDQTREAIATVRHNAARMKEEDAIETILADATQLGKSRTAYDLVFLDPPYFGKMLAPALESLKQGGWIADDAVIVIEHDAKEVVELPPSFLMIDERRYGRAVVKLLKAV